MDDGRREEEETREEEAEVGRGLPDLNEVSGGGYFEARGSTREAEEYGAAAEAAAAEVEARGGRSDGVPAATRANCEGVRDSTAAGAPPGDIFGTDRLEDGYMGSDCNATARDAPVATRCLLYTVKLPWDGQK